MRPEKIDLWTEFHCVSFLPWFVFVFVHTFGIHLWLCVDPFFCVLKKTSFFNIFAFCFHIEYLFLFLSINIVHDSKPQKEIMSVNWRMVFFWSNCWLNDNIFASSNWWIEPCLIIYVIKIGRKHLFGWFTRYYECVTMASRNAIFKSHNLTVLSISSLIFYDSMFFVYI